MFGNRDHGFHGEHDPFTVRGEADKTSLSTREFTKRAGISGGIAAAILVSCVLIGNYFAEKRSDQFVADTGEEVEKRFNDAKQDLVSDLREEFGKERKKLEESIEAQVDDTQAEIFVALGFSDASPGESPDSEKDCPLVLIECA